jgi:hypothetical protein
VEESAQRTSAGRSKTTLMIRLSADEYAELRRATSEGEFPNLSILVFHAIQTGLEKGEQLSVQGKRTRKVTIHVSSEFKQTIRARARMYRVTQQAFLHSLLFQYIRKKEPQNARAEETEGT